MSILQMNNHRKCLYIKQSVRNSFNLDMSLTNINYLRNICNLQKHVPARFQWMGTSIILRFAYTFRSAQIYLISKLQQFPMTI